MSKYTSWMQVGATWKESRKDMHEVRTRESFVTYRVLSPDGDQPQIEQQIRDPEGELETNTITPDDLISDGSILDIDPESGECVEINGYEHFMEKFENISLETGARPAYKLIRKKREDCPRCGGGGDCPDCSASGECSSCGNSGTCGDCSGEGTCSNCAGEGKCSYCDGQGRCSSCEGTGRVPDSPDMCSECKGSGRCTECNGSGACQTCKGSRKCNECLGSRKCSHCHGSGKCGYCNGGLKCRDCGGTGKAMVSSEYWYDQTTGLLLKYVTSVNKRPQDERLTLSMNVSTSGYRPQQTYGQQPYQRNYQPGGTLTIEQTPLQTPLLTYGPPSAVSGPSTGPMTPVSFCSTCGKDLRGVGATVFCPFCGGKLVR